MVLLGRFCSYTVHEFFLELRELVFRERAFFPKLLKPFKLSEDIVG